jgi:two-component system, OmpR family, response regulator MprA
MAVPVGRPQILVIDDDPRLTSALRRALALEGYAVETVNDPREGLIRARDAEPDLYILDVMMPHVDGLEVCRRLRSAGDTPILMLTAKDATPDRVKGLDSGADDYLVKPFAVEELLARVRALLRRRQPENERSKLRFGDLTLDVLARAASRGDRAIELRPREYELLEYFMRHPRQVLTKDQIYERVWGYDFEGESNVLDVYVMYLRQKLESRGEPRLLHNQRGVGYVLRE